MKKFGLIGHPIEHSLSPALFKAGYDGRYPYDLIQGEDFGTSYQRFIEEYDGINVTAPFKEQAYSKADIISDECRLCKAANLLVRTPDGVKAYNSDFLGVRQWLQEVLYRSPCHTTLVVGTGGAGRAGAAAAASLGMEVVLMNRNMERAERLADDLKSIGCDAMTRPLEDFVTCFRKSDIIIYNIPTAIPQMLDLTERDFTPGKPKYTFEANYKDPSFDEAFVGKMAEANPLAQHTGGLTWLLYQAVTGYEIFTGEKPDLNKMSDVL